MKFEPNKPSFIITLNLDTVKEDLEVIKEFCNEEPTPMVGFWKGEHKISYQLDRNKTNFGDMVATLQNLDQEVFLSISNTGRVHMHELKPYHTVKSYPSSSGRMTQIPDKEDCCTYCTISKTYWRAQ